MLRRARLAVVACVVIAGVSLTARVPRAQTGGDTLPTRLSDDEFWKLTETLSEPNGYFRSDNLLSNEVWFQYVIPDLLTATKPGSGVYLGVGPEQNFTYIAALKPKMVFITDIRRGNLWTQLMYKALFELSADRNEFVSRLFTKPKQTGLTATSSALDIMNKYSSDDAAAKTSDEATYKANSQAILDLLTKTHHLPLSDEDKKGIIDDVYYYFYWWGPSIDYNSSSGNGNGNGRGNMANYYTLMVAEDGGGTDRSYLSSEANFQFLKDLESRNLVVPVVGDLGGPKMVRAVGQYIRDHGATVSAYYLSNVEQYLSQDGKWNAFCGNIATMPLDAHSTFIRSANGGGGYGGGGGLMSSVASMQADTKGC